MEIGSSEVPPPNTGTFLEYLKGTKPQGSWFCYQRHISTSNEDLGPSGGHTCLEAAEVSNPVPDFPLYLMAGGRFNPPSCGKSAGQE